MHNGSNVSGIGCFAQSATLRRVLERALESFIMDKYEDICPPTGQILDDENVRRFFRSLIRFGTEKPDQIDRASESVAESAKITGFYLGLYRQSLHLIVFFQDAGRRPSKLVTRLEKLTRLRRQRLH